MSPADLHDDLIHIDICIERLGNCRRTLLDVRGNQGHPLTGPAFLHALVEYCTSFTTSQAADKKRRRLDAGMVPIEFKALHDRILATRNQLLAHADMSILEGSVAFQQYEGRLMTTTTMNYIDPLAELRNLDEIVSLVERVHLNLFMERKALLDVDAMPPKRDRGPIDG